MVISFRVSLLRVPRPPKRQEVMVCTVSGFRGWGPQASGRQLSAPRIPQSVPVQP